MNNETILYDDFDKYIDMGDAATKQILEMLEREFANACIKCLPQRPDQEKINLTLICATLAKMIATSPCVNEQLQMIADAIVTFNLANHHDKMECHITQQTDDDHWTIEGRDLC